MARPKKEQAAVVSSGERETISVQEFLSTRDSVVTGLTTLQNSIGDLLRAYMTHCNTIIGGGSSNSLNISNFLNNHSADGEVKKAKRTRVKKEKDPNAPKRPLTAYFLFSHHAREVIRGDLTAQNGVEPKSQDIQDEATRRWNAMEPPQKREWQDIYNKNYETYKTEVAEYNRLKDIAALAAAEGDAVAAAQEGTTTEEEDEDVEAEAEPEVEESEDEEEEAAPPPKAPSPPRALSPPKETKTPRATKARKNAKANGVAPTPAPVAAPAAISPTPVARPFETRVPLPTETSRSSLIAPPDVSSVIKPTNGRKKRKEPSPELAPNASSPVAEETAQPKKKKAKKSKAGEELATEVEPTASPVPVETPAAKAGDKKEKKKKRKSEATGVA